MYTFTFLNISFHFKVCWSSVHEIHLQQKDGGYCQCDSTDGKECHSWHFWFLFGGGPGGEGELHWHDGPCSYIEWLLAKQNVKRAGNDNFVGWSFPIDRQLFVVNDKALSSFSGPTFSLEQIVPWSSLKGLKNGFQAGARNLLLPRSSIKAWLAFLRIFFEVC